MGIETIDRHEEPMPPRITSCKLFLNVSVRKDFKETRLTCIPARRNILCAEKERRYFQFRRGTLIIHEFNSYFNYAKHSVIISQPVTTSPVEYYLKMMDGCLNSLVE